MSADAKLLDDLSALMLPHGARAQRMFGGTCFMLNGNLALGTHKQGLIVRIGADALDEALALGATPMVMGGRTMKGWVMVDQPQALMPWVMMALAFNATLPPEAAKKASRKT